MKYGNSYNTLNKNKNTSIIALRHTYTDSLWTRWPDHNPPIMAIIMLGCTVPLAAACRAFYKFSGRGKHPKNPVSIVYPAQVQRHCQAPTN